MEVFEEPPIEELPITSSQALLSAANYFIFAAVNVFYIFADPFLIASSLAANLFVSSTEFLVESLIAPDQAGDQLAQ